MMARAIQIMLALIISFALIAVTVIVETLNSWPAILALWIILAIAIIVLAEG